MMEYHRIARRVADTADDKLGINIIALDVRGHSSITDCFIFVGATSHLHVQALEDAIREALRKDGMSPLRTDGKRGHLWRALDYGSVIVHIMEQKIRDFYSIERLWNQGKEITSSLLRKKERTKIKKDRVKKVKKRRLKIARKKKSR